MSGEAGAADTAARLAALLAAGLPPPAAWGHLADAPDAPAPVRAAAAASSQGASPVPALGAAGGAWRELACALAVAERTGAASGPALDAVAGALEEATAARRDADAALAGPRLSARVVLGLPAVAVLFAYGMGIDVLGTLRTAPGLVVFAAGTLLYAAGALWIRRLAAGARSLATVPGLALELVALALAAGLPAERALQVAAEEAAALGLAVDSDAVRPLLGLATRSGAPVARLMRAEAARLRRRVAADAKERAARLGVLLLLPLGVCMLPAFLLVGVAPVLLGLLGTATPR